MLIDHPHYGKPDDSTVIWRYLDYWKFESLVRSSTLYFSRADELTKLDAKEGQMTKELKKLIDEKLFTSKFVLSLKRGNVITFGRSTKIQGRSTLEIRDELRRRARQHYRYILNRTYINCWHINNAENPKMWRDYISNPPGVVVRTSIGRLKQALAGEQADVYALNVDYIDHEVAPLEPHKLPGGMSQIVLDMLSKKTTSLSGEAELRLVTDTLNFQEKWAPNIVGSHLNAHATNTVQSVDLRINLESLVEAVVLYPGASSSFRDYACRALSTYGYPQLAEGVSDSSIPNN